MYVCIALCPDHSYIVSGDLNLESFQVNVKKRVEQISKLSGPTVEVGLRTSIWKDKHGGKEDYLTVILALSLTQCRFRYGTLHLNFSQEMNKVIRDISAHLNCSLYDLDQDAW